jgi:REP element-mobilizing transposase RayT
MNTCHDSDKHHRRSLRLQEYDYTQEGAYFVTVCLKDRACLFGDIADGKMILNDAGRMVQAVWDDIPSHYAGIDTDAFIIMPNHIHAIIVIVGATPCGRPDSDKGQAQGPDNNGQARGLAPTRNTKLSLADVVHRLKTITTKRYTDGVKQMGWPPFHGRLWQRNYYEHVIRDDASLNLIRQYIIDNPLRWAEDEENPAYSAATIAHARAGGSTADA